MMTTRSPRGFTLLVAVILSSVILSVGLALADIAYKQVVLSSSASDSQYAFYAADTAMECALYWDQQRGAFAYDAGLGSITCNGHTFGYAANSTSGGRKTVEFDVPCSNGSGTLARVTVYKHDPMGSGYCSGTPGSPRKSCIYANGYSSCNASDSRRIERGIKAAF